jgi:hypothetical protein
MRIGSTPPRFPIVLTALAALGLAGTGPAQAGPGTYDPQQRSFQLTYTFADLPGQFGTLDDAKPMESTPEQNAVMRGLIAEAGHLLFSITDQRAKFGRLDLVDAIEEADIVISLTGRPVAAAWATTRKSLSERGFLVVYYNFLMDLLNDNRQDAVATILHCFGHYAFGLADEYVYAEFPGGCPATADGMPGCLMDNYFTSGPRHGWLGRLCDETNHNSRNAQPKSCQTLVDEFFAAHGNPPKVIDREGVAFREVKQEASKRIRAYAQEQLQGKTTLAINSSELRDRTGEILRDLLDQRKIVRSGAEVELAAREIAGSISGVLRAEKKGRIESSPRLDERLQGKAAELAAHYPQGRYARSTRLALLRKPLLELALGALGGTLQPEECQYIDSIVQKAVPVIKLPSAPGGDDTHR